MDDRFGRPHGWRGNQNRLTQTDFDKPSQLPIQHGFNGSCISAQCWS
jgi:hypothetical protein